MSRDKTSSLRLRLDRVRNTYDSKVHLTRLLVGAAFVVLAAIGLLLVF